MKKLLSSVAILMVCGLLHAGYKPRGIVPLDSRGNPVHLNTYTGVDTSTIAFSSANVMCFSGEGTLVGFICSSFDVSSVGLDYIVFRATVGLTGTTSDYSTDSEIARVYLSTTNYGTPPIGMTYTFPAPIHGASGIAAKCTIRTLNMITYLIHKY